MSQDDQNPIEGQEYQEHNATDADTASGIDFDAQLQHQHHSSDFEVDSDMHAFGHGSGGGHNHAAGGSHGTEMGWLVSYADMMTLLFGLFVLLYTMQSSSSKSELEEKMKKISQSAFGGEVSKSELDKTTPDDMVKKLLERNEKMADDLKSAQIQIEQKKDKTVTEAEKAELQKKIEELQSTITEQQKSQQDQQRQIASISQDTTKSEKIVLENQKLKAELDKLIQQQKEVTATKAQTNPNNFLMISTTWASEKHDIDLEIVDTNNKKFNFKKKSYGGVDGQFEIDSRYGPGLEMWKTPKLQAGQYKVKVTLYNTNGNDNPAEVQTNVITVSENTKLPMIKLSKAEKTKEVRFSVDEKGKVTVEQ